MILRLMRLGTVSMLLALQLLGIAFSNGIVLCKHSDGSWCLERVGLTCCQGSTNQDPQPINRSSGDADCGSHAVVASTDDCTDHVLTIGDLLPSAKATPPTPIAATLVASIEWPRVAEPRQAIRAYGAWRPHASLVGTVILRC